MLDELSQYRSSQMFDAYQRRELERDTLKLEGRYHFMSEMEESELQYWMKVFGEVKIEHIPESNEPF